MNTSVLLVRDVMTIGVPVCSENDLCREVEARLARQSVSAEIVVALDENGIATGWLARERLARSGPAATVGEAMDEEFPSVQPDIPAEAAAQIMRDRGVEYLFLMHDWPGERRPAAFVSRHSLKNYLPNEAAKAA